VDAASVLVLRNAGPKGAPGMPEWATCRFPKAAESRNPRHGPHFRCANEWNRLRRLRPSRLAESFVGGPLALLKEGDRIELDAHARTLNMLVSEDELSRRRAAWRPKDGIYPRGYGKLFMQHIKQADEGCDFDFLEGTASIPEPEIH